MCIRDRFIARRLEAEEARRREKQYRRTQEFAQVGSWEYDTVCGLLTGSHETGRIFGLTGNIREIPLPLLSKVFHPSDRERIIETLDRFVKGELETYDVEYRIIRENDGAVRTVHSVAQVIEDDAGRITTGILAARFSRALNLSILVTYPIFLKKEGLL